MGGSSRRIRLCSGVALSALILVAGANGSAKAEATDAQIKALQAQVEVLARTVKELKEAQTHTAADAQAAKKQASQADANSAQAKATAADAHAKSTRAPVKSGWGGLDSNGHAFLERKPGKDLTFFTPGGEITAYGQLDVSLDVATKNANGAITRQPQGDTTVGNFGWMPGISTNISYLGVRGFQRIPTQSFNFVYQFEAGIDISAAPGDKQSNSNLSNQVNGALFSRNSFIGLASSDWGAIKVGKSDGPYKNSTAALNPFSGMWGDYAVIMGNSGGDNRVEFGTRISHAIWYESPKFGGGFQFNVMFAPGQNRADDSSNLASGESDCAGGNDPTSGGNPLVNCSDGGFSNAVSTNLSYTNGPFYITAAYEFHQNVNRSSDIAAIYGIPATLIGPQNCGTLGFSTALGVQLCNEDVANEDAAKIAAMYKFSTGTTVGVIGERLHRYVSADLAFQNERSRYGTWLVVSQQLTPQDSLHFGWAHAFKAEGDPGQHNSGTLTTDGGAASYAPNDNQADMLTAAYKHMYSENLTWYTNVAATFNGPSAHYDLGAGGRGVTTDCHDASNASGGINSAPQCWTGTTLVGISTGLQWKF
jgi:predicted porin